MTTLEAAPTLYQDSTALLQTPELLRARAAEEGVLFFKQMLPRQEVLAVRHDIIGVCRAQGWLKPGAEGDLGVCNLDIINQIPAAQITGGAGIPHPVYAEVQKLESFHRIAHHPSLIHLYTTLFNEAAFVHPRNIARIILPHKDCVPTPAHQDFIHVQGASNTWTCWFPLGDCPTSLGGLTVLAKSHTQGIRHIKSALGAGGAESQICQNETGWQQANFEAGDLVTFPSLTVHKAMPNHFKDRLRLSCDFRYQPASDPIEQASLLPHLREIPWDDIYANWKHNDLKYYWKSQTPPLSPWDESVRWQKQRIC